MSGKKKMVRLPSSSASARSEWFPELPAALHDAVNKYPLADTPDWATLAELSPQTVFRGIDVSSANSVFDGGSFIAPGTVHVTLQFDPDSPDAKSFDDIYPARVYFKIVTGGDSPEKSTVTIERVETDTTSFFE